MTLTTALSLLCLQGTQVTGPDVFFDPSSAPTGRFGADVAMEGGLMVVGAPGPFSSASAEGSVLVYRYDGIGYTFEQRIDPPAGFGGDFGFGESVDVTGGGAAGEFVIVGTSRAQLPITGIERGAAHVFEFTSAGWVNVATLLGDGSLEAFGASVAIDDTTAVIGQTDFDGRAFSASRRANGSWQIDGELPRPATVFSGADFGAAVDLNRDVIVVGAPGEDAAAYDSGAAYVYRRTAAGSLAFDLESRLEHPSAATLTFQGIDVAVDDNGFGVDRVVVGSLDEKAFVWTGSASGNWALEALLTPFDGEVGGWGTAVAIDGARLVVGAPWRVGSAPSSGAAMGFYHSPLPSGPQGWYPTGLLHPGSGVDEGVGGSVAISAGFAAVGASLFDGSSTNSGALLMYSQGLRRGELHCAGRSNAVQSTASIAAFGSTIASEMNIGFDVTGLAPNTPGFLLASRDRAQIPGLGGGAGDLCLGGTIGRISQQLRVADAAGNATVDLQFTGLPGVVQLTAGSTWSFQWWYRDLGLVPTSNTSHAVELMFF